MKITIEAKTVYGNHVFYPVCLQAQIFAQIAGTKTLKPETIKSIQKLGYEIEMKQTALSF